MENHLRERANKEGHPGGVTLFGTGKHGPEENAAFVLQKLGERVMKLSNENIKLIDLLAALHQAVLLAKALKKHGPRRPANVAHRL
jgi:ribosomal 50S subunit-associated protein YjgA (DUF615 family)